MNSCFLYGLTYHPVDKWEPNYLTRPEWHMVIGTEGETSDSGWKQREDVQNTDTETRPNIETEALEYH